jgi:hypothetical protein
MSYIYILTKSGENKIEQFIAECKAKRKEILDSGIDTADYTNLPTKEDIMVDLDFTGIDEYDEYCGYFAITDYYDSDTISLTLGVDFTIKER